MNKLIALVAGILFGGGLAISGMTDTHKVIGFLDIAGKWDPSLAFVMGVALMLVVPVFFLLKKMKKPILANKFCLPKNTLIDKKLMIGSVLFGVGWGLYGYCPGPAIASLTYLGTDSFVFVGCMFVGMFVTNRLMQTRSSE